MSKTEKRRHPPPSSTSSASLESSTIQAWRSLGYIVETSHNDILINRWLLRHFPPDRNRCASVLFSLYIIWTAFMSTCYGGRKQKKRNSRKKKKRNNRYAKGIYNRDIRRKVNTMKTLKYIGGALGRRAGRRYWPRLRSRHCTLWVVFPPLLHAHSNRHEEEARGRCYLACRDWPRPVRVAFPPLSPAHY